MPASRGLYLAWLSFSAVAAFAASSCALSVDFDGSRYRCDPPDSTECPEGYSCGSDGFCDRESELPDAAVADAPEGQPDGAVVPDAALTPDAPPQIITRTFGERPGSDVQGVTQDTMLREDNPNGNFGVTTEFLCDNTENNAPRLSTGLLRFDLSSIPPGATVLSASFELWTFDDPLDQGTIQWFRVNEAWDEGNFNGQAGFANFSQRKQGFPWSASGARSPASGTTVIAEAFTPEPQTAYTFVLSKDVVQAWVSSPATNFGMACFVSPGVDSDSDYKSRNSSQTERRPELTVTYVP